jgi:putative transposase
MEAGAARASLSRRREKGVWQRRYWEHTIRDEADWQRHVDYVHFNPVKHGYVTRPEEWPYSSFHRAVATGWYDAGWGELPPSLAGLDAKMTDGHAALCPSYLCSFAEEGVNTIFTFGEED